MERIQPRHQVSHLSMAPLSCLHRSRTKTRASKRNGSSTVPRTTRRALRIPSCRASKQAALSDKAPGKSMKYYGRAGTKTAARFVKKHVKKPKFD